MKYAVFFLDVWHKGEPLVHWFDASAAQISMYNETVDASDNRYSLFID